MATETIEVTRTAAKNLKSGDDLGGWIVESVTPGNAGLIITMQGGGSMAVKPDKMFNVTKQPAYKAAKMTRPWGMIGS
jgi:hypothetical protein